MTYMLDHIMTSDPNRTFFIYLILSRIPNLKIDRKQKTKQSIK